MSITIPVVGIHSNGYENDIVPGDFANSKPLVPNYGPYYYHAKRGELSNLTTYHDGLNEIVHDGNRITRNNPCQIAIIKRYTLVNKGITGRAGSSIKKRMIEMFGRVIDVQMSDLTGAEENFLNHMHELSFEEQVNTFETQLYHMKNKIGVFRDPIFPKSLPWIIPRFTFDCEKGDTYKKAHVFIINQEFHRANSLVHTKEFDDEFIYWQFKHYEIFHVNDPSVTWGPYDIGMHNLLFDSSARLICFIDNEGFKSFTFDRHDTIRYKVMSMINPNIGEYLPGKDCNTPYEVIKNDWIMNGDVKVFFKRLYFYTKVIFNLQSNTRGGSSIDGSDGNISNDKIMEKIINECKVGLESGKLLYQNWFHHEGDRVMHMTEEYVPAHPDAKRLSKNFMVGNDIF